MCIIAGAADGRPSAGLEVQDDRETLLRRRLEEKQASIRILRVGRGQVRLEARGTLILDTAQE